MTEKPLVLFLEKDDAVVKFVQLYVEGEPYLRCGKEGEPHSEILERTLKEFELEFELTNSIQGYLIPEPRGEKYESSGMGLMTKFEDEFLIFKKSRSVDYGLEPNTNHLKKLSSLLPKKIKFELV